MDEALQHEVLGQKLQFCIIRVVDVIKVLKDSKAFLVSKVITCSEQGHDLLTLYTGLALTGMEAIVDL